MSRSEFTKFNVEENIRTMEKSLICRGLTISQEDGQIWKKMSHTYDAKVPKVTVISRATVEKDVLSRGLTS